MSLKEQDVERLQEENRKLKEDNEILLKTIVQLRVTLNRLLDRFVTE